MKGVFLPFAARAVLAAGETDRSRRLIGPRVEAALDAARSYLEGRQSPSGCWEAELLGDSTLGSDAVMLMHALGRVDAGRQSRFLAFVLNQQNPDGGWPIYHGGPSNRDATVKAYFALRLAGHDDSEPALARARRRILDLGGIEACNSYTKFYLALFGQYDWERLPTMLPEFMLLPPQSWGFNLYRVSAWTRTIIVPMLIIYGMRPRVEVPFSIHDLAVPYDPPAPKTRKQAFWSGFFKLADRALNAYNRLHIRTLRKRALDAARRWMLERLRPAGGLGAIYPPMMNAIIALKCLGYRRESPEFARALREFENLEVRDGSEMRIQPCFSVVWDTAWAVHALARTGGPGAEAVRHGADWLLSKEIFTGGDWQVRNPGVEPAAWAFEFDNPIYPDTDDTSAVLMALFFADRQAEPGFEKALRWLLSMQNPDGGWGAFDRNIDIDVLNYIPWADHNALLDPSTADLTGRILELLGYLGYAPDRPAVRKGIDFLRRTQEPDGSWFGRWGVNYVYGTWQVLVGLRAAGQDMRADWIQKAARWLGRVQNADGGWGETCRSYDDPDCKGIGPSTPSQTAWGLLGLLAAGLPAADPAAVRAAEWLIRRQREDGGWDETEHTGTGFPRVFYLVYTMYRHYFPLLALHAFRAAAGGNGEALS